MEKEEIKKGSKNEDDLIENIAGFVYMNNTEKRPYDDIYAEIEEAYSHLKQYLKKEMELIVSEMLHANMDPGLISNMEKEVYSESRASFFNQVLYGGVENIEKIRSTVQEEALQPFEKMFDNNGEIKKTLKYEEAEEVVKTFFFKDTLESNSIQTTKDTTLLNQINSSFGDIEKYKGEYKIDKSVMQQIDENDKRTQELFADIDMDAILKNANKGNLESSKKLIAFQRAIVLLDDVRSYAELGVTEKLEFYKTLRYLLVVGDDDSKKVLNGIIERKLPQKIQDEIYVQDENGNKEINEMFLKSRIVKVNGAGCLTDAELESELEFEAKTYSDNPEYHFKNKEAFFEEGCIESKKVALSEFMRRAYTKASFISDDIVTKDGVKYSHYEAKMKYMDEALREFKEMAMKSPDAALYFARESLDLRSVSLEAKSDPLLRKYIMGVADATMDVLLAVKTGKIPFIEDKYTTELKQEIFECAAQNMIEVNDVDTRLLQKMVLVDRVTANRAAKAIGVRALLDITEDPDRPNLAEQARKEDMKPLTEEKREQIASRKSAYIYSRMKETVDDANLRNDLDGFQKDILKYYKELDSDIDRKEAAGYIIDTYFSLKDLDKDDKSRDSRKELFGELLKLPTLSKVEREALIRADKGVVMEVLSDLSQNQQSVSMEIGNDLRLFNIKDKRMASFIDFSKKNNDLNKEQKQLVAQKWFADDKSFMEQCEHNRLVFEGSSLVYTFEINKNYNYNYNTFLKPDKASYPAIDMLGLTQKKDDDDGR